MTTHPVSMPMTDELRALVAAYADLSLIHI